MDRLEKIIIQKDYVIDGLRQNLDKALKCLEGGVAEKLKEESNNLLTDEENATSYLKYELKKKNKEIKGLQKTIQSYESAVEILT